MIKYLCCSLKCLKWTIANTYTHIRNAHNTYETFLLFSYVCEHIRTHLRWTSTDRSSSFPSASGEVSIKKRGLDLSFRFGLFRFGFTLVDTYQRMLDFRVLNTFVGYHFGLWRYNHTFGWFLH